ncbi:helix-turn-helix domain-containing protein [Sphingobium fluviale]|nr:helix-turn-helix domain-containing protein [Sphingobium fluviale]
MTAVRMRSSDIKGNPLAYWQDVVCDLFVPLTCNAAESRSFDWEFVSDGISDLRLVEMRVTPHHVSHTREHVRRSADAYFILSQHVNGTGVVVQDGREAALQPGDLALYDSTRPYDLRFAGSMHQRIVRIPQRLLSDRLAHAERFTARPVRAQTPIGRLCSDFVTSSFGIIGHAGSVGTTVRDTLIDLLCAALRENTLSTRLDSAVSADVLRRRIIRYVETNLSDPDLNVEQIAGAMRMSARYVHMLMREMDSTPGRLIWSLRLDRCAQALSDPANAAIPVAQIAYAWGYKDAAHFARSFRSRFDISPGDYRRRALDQDTQA